MNQTSPLVHAISVQRDGDDHAVEWCFDVDAQLALALSRADENKAAVLSNEVRPQRAGDMISDADELQNWLTFAYLDDSESEAA